MADKYGITEHIEFGKTVNTTVWNEQNDEWIVTLDNGEVSRLSGIWDSDYFAYNLPYFQEILGLLGVGITYLQNNTTIECAFTDVYEQKKTFKSKANNLLANRSGKEWDGGAGRGEWSQVNTF